MLKVVCWILKILVMYCVGYSAEHFAIWVGASEVWQHLASIAGMIGYLMFFRFSNKLK